MAEEEPVERAPITRCQHCPDIIEKHGTMWMDKGNGQVICDRLYLDLLHKPMPRVPA